MLILTMAAHVASSTDRSQNINTKHYGKKAAVTVQGNARGALNVSDAEPAILGSWACKLELCPCTGILPVPLFRALVESFAAILDFAFHVKTGDLVVFFKFMALGSHVIKGMCLVYVLWLRVGITLTNMHCRSITRFCVCVTARCVHHFCLISLAFSCYPLSLPTPSGSWMPIHVLFLWASVGLGQNMGKTWLPRKGSARSSRDAASGVVRTGSGDGGSNTRRSNDLLAAWQM